MQLNPASTQTLFFSINQLNPISIRMYKKIALMRYVHTTFRYQKYPCSTHRKNKHTHNPTEAVHQVALALITQPTQQYLKQISTVLHKDTRGSLVILPLTAR